MLYKLLHLLKAVALYSFLFVAFGVLLEAYNPPVQNVGPVAAAASVKTTARSPETLVISRLDIKLSIIPGVYDPDTKAWTLTGTSLQHAVMTGLPGDHTGSMLLYGHNTDKVLAPTSGLKKGDIATITTQDGSVYSYIYRSDRFVVPTDTSVLEQTDSNHRLILLTCDGLWDERRRLMTFDFVGVE